jgi:hypothetical protein
MTTSANTRPRTPPHFVAYRAVITVVTWLILLALGLGLAGYGPLPVLHDLVTPLTNALHLNQISG